MKRVQFHGLVVLLILTVSTGFFQAGAGHPFSSKVAYADIPALEELQQTFIRIADKVKPSVVGIRTERANRGPNRDDDDGSSPQASGTGIIVGADGVILTNYHVVRSAVIVWVVFDAERRDVERARVLGTDSVSDLAVLKVERKGLVPIEFGNSDAVKVGAWVVAIGNPFGQTSTVTAGIVSGKGRHLGERQGGQTFQSLQDYIQTDAAINPGNSGGPLVDIQGRLVGINTAILSQTGGNMGIGFAVPVNTVKKVMPRLARGEKIARGFLGIIYSELTRKEADDIGLPSSAGFQVSKVQEKTPAEEAGVQKGDIIIGYAAQKAESSEAFRQLISETPPGTRLPLRIIRFGDDGSSKEMTLTVTLRERDTDDVAPTPEQHKSLLGMTVEDLTPQIRRDLNIRLDREGPVVTQVDAGGPADEAGVERRLILRKAKVGSAKTFMNVRRARDFDGLLADVKTGVAVVFLLEDPDDSSVRYFSVTARSPEK